MPTRTPTSDLRTVLKNVLAGTLGASYAIYEKGYPRSGPVIPSLHFDNIIEMEDGVVGQRIDGTDNMGYYDWYRMQITINERSETTRDTTSDKIKGCLAGTVAAGSFNANDILPYPKMILSVDQYIPDEGRAFRKIMDYRFRVMFQSN